MPMLRTFSVGLLRFPGAGAGMLLGITLLTAGCVAEDGYYGSGYYGSGYSYYEPSYGYSYRPAPPPSRSYWYNDRSRDYRRDDHRNDDHRREVRRDDHRDDHRNDGNRGNGGRDNGRHDGGHRDGERINAGNGVIITRPVMPPQGNPPSN